MAYLESPKIKKIIKLLKNKHLFLALILFLFVFFLYSFLAFNHPKKFISPDETAYHFFIVNFIKTGKIYFKDPLILESDLIHPRNTAIKGDKIVPAGFLGIVLIYGSLGKILGEKSIFYYTPFFGALALYFFYLLIKEIHNKKLAFLSVTLLAIHPAWWYLSSLSFMPNLLFVALLIISAYFLVKALKTKHLIFYILFALFLAFSLMVRLNEVIWIFFLLFFILVFYWKKINYRKLALSFLVFILAFIPLIYLNLKYYHTLWGTSYGLEKEIIKISTPQSSLGIFIKKIILPFGFNKWDLIYTVDFYLWRIILPFVLISVLGSFWLLKNSILDKKIKSLGYLILVILVSLYLASYYSAGSFFANYKMVIKPWISSSLVRYFLPLYVFLTPLGALFLLGIKKYFSKKRLFYSILSIFILSLALYSLRVVILDPVHGLNSLKETLKKMRVKANQTKILTEEEAIIIAGKSEKIFFPERRVIAYDLNQEKVLEFLQKNVSSKYFYYYTKGKEKAKYLNKNILKKYSLILTEPQEIYLDEYLYKIKPLELEAF